MIFVVVFFLTKDMSQFANSSSPNQLWQE